MDVLDERIEGRNQVALSHRDEDRLFEQLDAHRPALLVGERSPEVEPLLHDRHDVRTRRAAHAPLGLVDDVGDGAFEFVERGAQPLSVLLRVDLVDVQPHGGERGAQPVRQVGGIASLQLEHRPDPACQLVEPHADGHDLCRPIRGHPRREVALAELGGRPRQGAHGAHDRARHPVGGEDAEADESHAEQAEDQP